MFLATHMGMIRNLEIYNDRKGKGRWGKKKFEDTRNWIKMNEMYVVRGEFYLDFEFVKEWNKELKSMNKGKVGAPFLFPESFIRWLTVWHQFVDYRGLEGISRSITKLGLIPRYEDYTTAWHRIHKMKPEFVLPDYNDLEIGSDGSGLKTNNAGEYRIFKYGDRTKKKHVVVVITTDLKHRKLLEVDAYIDGEGLGEPKTSMKHIRKLTRNGKKIKSFCGDGGFDTNDIFNMLNKLGIEPKIPVQINASSSGSGPPRRKEIRKQFNLPTGKKSHNHYFKDTEKRRRKYQKRWRTRVKHGDRWPGNEGMFSAVKRKLGENVVSRNNSNMIAEAIQRFWVYDVLCNYANKKM